MFIAEENVSMTILIIKYLSYIVKGEKKFCKKTPQSISLTYNIRDIFIAVNKKAGYQMWCQFQQTQ